MFVSQSRADLNTYPPQPHTTCLSSKSDDLRSVSVSNSCLRHYAAERNVEVSEHVLSEEISRREVEATNEICNHCLINLEGNATVSVHFTQLPGCQACLENCSSQEDLERKDCILTLFMRPCQRCDKK